MPSKKVITPLMGGRYYHLFNRGINRQKVFFNRENYFFFLKQLERYLTGYVDILAYCLLPNHFHLIVRLNDELNLQDRLIISEEETGKLVSNQFRRLFISYSMAINKQEGRSGGLFESKFKRLEIEDEEYLRYAIFYTHYNPQKHRLETDFRNYKFSSYKAIVSPEVTKVNKQLVWELFGSRQEFLAYHQFIREEKEAVILE